ncbi:MAG: HAMP domain-containing protein [Desulfobacterales bacterium]|nr:HAMP domain-containing protein [Desulfobacterales bacterium]
MTDTLKQNNLLLAGILAYNSRIGVFSENEELLENPIEGIFQQKETEAVSIYNTNGELLKERRRTGSENANRTAGEMKAKILDIFKTSTSPYYFENKDTMEFWSPVIASSGYSNAESLFLDDKSLPAQKRTIGFVRIIVGKSVLSKKLDVLLIKSVLIGLVFLFAGCAVIYFTVIRIVNPLNKLIKGVQTLGKGEFGKKVPVETEDEIGKLALAFNQMSESLQRREAEKEQLEAQLRHSHRMEAIGTLAGEALPMTLTISWESSWDMRSWRY